MVGVAMLEDEIKPLAGRHGLALYDVEVVPLGRPMLRVFVEKGQAPDNGESGRHGVMVGDMETFAKVLIPFLNLKGLFPRDGHVEVSSPGMNRRLRNPKHFTAAIGQPINVTVRCAAGKQTVKVRLLAVTDKGITLESEDLPYVPFVDILRAQLQPEITF